VASDDPFVLGVLSSRIHRVWALATGGALEDRPIYTKTACFDRFPFPEPEPGQRVAIAAVAEALDRVRTEVLAARPGLTMTGFYNALEAGDETEEVARVRRLQARLDDLVAEAYGWAGDLAAEAVVAGLVQLKPGPGPGGSRGAGALAETRVPAAGPRAGGAAVSEAGGVSCGVRGGGAEAAAGSCNAA
jgi:hypothetical protein